MSPCPRLDLRSVFSAPSIYNTQNRTASFYIPYPWVRKTALEKGMATYSSILAWENPIDKGVWQAQVHGIAGARHNWVTNTFTFRIKNVSPASAYRDFCLALVGKKTLTHLALEGSVHGDKMLLLLLCEVLKHPRCNLQYLRWVLCHCCPQHEKDAVSSEQNRGLPCWLGTMLNRGAYSQILTEYQWYVSQ